MKGLLKDSPFFIFEPGRRTNSVALQQATYSFTQPLKKP